MELKKKVTKQKKTYKFEFRFTVETVGSKVDQQPR